MHSGVLRFFCGSAAIRSSPTTRRTAGAPAAAVVKKMATFGSYYEKVSSDAEAESTPLAGHKTASRTNAAKVRMQIIIVCCLYAFVGPALVLINNHILKSLSFPFPLFLSALGLITTSCVCAFILHVLPRLQELHRPLSLHSPSRRSSLDTPDAGTELTAVREGIVSPPSPRSRADSSPAEAPPVLTRGGSGSDLGGGSRGSGSELGGGVRGGITLDFWLRNMIPIGAAQGVTFASTNAAYMYLTITFTQMLAAFTPTVTLVLLYLFGVEVPTLRASVCVFVIGLGCVLSSYGEGHFSMVGVAYRSLGIFSEATRLVLTQHLLKNHKLTVFESQCAAPTLPRAIIFAPRALRPLSRPRALTATDTCLAGTTLPRLVRASCSSARPSRRCTRRARWTPSARSPRTRRSSAPPLSSASSRRCSPFLSSS